MAHDVLVRVARDRAYADRALDTALARAPLDARDRALVTELVYGTLRQSQRLDFHLSRLLKQPLRKLPIPALVALRMGAYQLLDLRTPAHAAINDAVSLVRHRHQHLAGVANAVLRKLAAHRDQGTLPDPERELTDPIEALAVGGAHPTWLVRRIVSRLGVEETRAWIAADNASPPLTLRAGRRTTRDALAAKLRQADVQIELDPQVPEALHLRGAGRVASLPGFAAGDFAVQDKGAQLIGRLLRPAPGSVVLDACAAPGGKAAQLAEMMGDTGIVLAADVHRAKLRLIAANAERLGLRSIYPATADASDARVLSELLDEHRLTHADYALVDAPCSGLGTLRRNPELRQRAEADLRVLTRLQSAILDAVAGLVRPGGSLVYAVCTITDEEGPERVQAFLEAHPEFRLDWPDDPILAPFAEPLAGGLALRTWTHRHGCDGFFAARLTLR